MAHLFKNVKVVQPGAETNGKTLDILIEEGKITKVGRDIKDDGAKIVEREGLCASLGWIDTFCNFMDPGHEYKETLVTGLNAAVSGGFVKVVTTSDTFPAIDSAAQVNDLLHRSEGHICSILPLGCISKGMQQNNMAELYDMAKNGAVAFCDGKKHVASAELMRISMEYAVGANVNVWSFPKDANIAGAGYMHEGITSTVSGIKGVPALAEELAVSREIQMSRYTGCPIHFPMVSTKGSVALLKQAQDEGLKVSAGVASYHLRYSEEDLIDLDSNLKTDHPLRTVADRDALREAVASGVIATIASDHTPQDTEAKVREFSQADYGMINLQTSFAMAMGGTGLKVEDVITALTMGPRNVLGMDVPVISEGEIAELTFFCPNEKWTFNETNNRSRSQNSPVLGKELVGRPVAVANNGQVEVLI